eukprot:2096468-Heterocapsa_arctica.AAC.1
MFSPSDVSGRGDAVRIRHRVHVDITLMVLYCPPSTTGAAARLLYDKVLSWASHVLNKLPKRTVPVVMMDSIRKHGFLALRRSLEFLTFDSSK